MKMQLENLRSSFAEGVMKILDIGGALRQIELPTDDEALESDWNAVISDMNATLGIASNENPPSPKSLPSLNRGVHRRVPSFRLANRPKTQHQNHAAGRGASESLSRLSAVDVVFEKEAH